LPLFAAAGGQTGCDTGAREFDADNTGSGTAGAAPAASINIPENDKMISVKFNVLNGGGGLKKSQGIVGSQDNRDLVYDGNICANDFTITITVPKSDEYVNIYWHGMPIRAAEKDRYLIAKLKIGEYGAHHTIVIDYNGNSAAVTENLFDIFQGSSDEYSKNYTNALMRARKDDN